MFTSLFRIIRLAGIAFAGFALILVGIGAAIAWQEYLTNKLQNSYAFLEPRLDELLETANGSRNNSYSPLDYTALKKVVAAPKIVAITTQVGTGDAGWVKRKLHEVDPIMLSVPKEWLPKNADEANIVIACHWSTEYYGEYSNGAKGHIDVGKFVGYDLKTGVVLFEGTAAGGNPPLQTKTTGAVYGSRGDANLVEQIRKGLELTQNELNKLTELEVSE